MNQRELRRRKRRRQRRIRAALLLLAMICLLGLIGVAGRRLISPADREKQTEAASRADEAKETDSSTEKMTEPEIQTETQTEAKRNMMPGLQTAMDNLYSAHAVVIRASNGAVIAEKSPEERTYPASLTKIMTALVAIQHLEDLQESITLPADIFEELYLQDASLSGFSPGETVTAQDLLYGVMLPSGAESCIALADRIGGSEDGFVALMNEKAAELGMTGTHFTNSSGLHSEDHYTTVSDLGILLQEALKNETFRQIFVSRNYTTQSTESHPDGITFEASVFKNMNEDQSMRSVGVIQGGKTGYTLEAGLCLASMGIVGQEEFLVITTGAEGSHETVQFNIEDALKVYEAIGSV